MRLAAALRPDPLGDLQSIGLPHAGPLAVIRGRGEREGEGKVWE